MTLPSSCILYVHPPMLILKSSNKSNVYGHFYLTLPQIQFREEENDEEGDYSKAKQAERSSYRANLSNDMEINNFVKKGDWKHQYKDHPPATFGEVTNFITAFYNLGDVVASSLIFHYSTVDNRAETRKR